MALPKSNIFHYLIVYNQLHSTHIARIGKRVVSFTAKGDVMAKKGEVL